MPLLEVKNLRKVYSARLKTIQVEALKNITFSVEEGEYVAIMGESGSGKSTLLNLLATLDKPTEGEIFLEEKPVAKIKQKQLCSFRRDNLGLVFQDFNLLDTLSLQDNILLPFVLQGEDCTKKEKEVKELSALLGIETLLNKFPYEVSGGQKQRCAVARALITNPKIILADEPTGALDSKASSKLLKLFSRINKAGQTILMVTHSTQAASNTDRVIFIKDGMLFNQIYRGNMNNEELYKKISDTLTVIQTGGGDDE